MKGGQLKNMKIELNQEELNYLIEIVTERKNDMLTFLIDNDDITLDLDSYTQDLSSLYDLKTKLCNYSIMFMEEN